MACGDNDIASTFKQLIVDCDECPSLAVEELACDSYIPLGCDDDLSWEDIFFRLINSTGDAIKIIKTT